MTKVNERLSGKTALVTGGSRSIGAAIAKRLAADGAAVAITYSASPDKAAAVVKEIEDAGGRAIAIHADSGNPDSVRAAVAKTQEAFGSLDILVNNAGIALGGPIEEIKFEDYERMIAVNVTGVFVGTQEAARRRRSHYSYRLFHGPLRRLPDCLSLYVDEGSGCGVQSQPRAGPRS